MLEEKQAAALGVPNEDNLLTNACCIGYGGMGMPVWNAPEVVGKSESKVVPAMYGLPELSRATLAPPVPTEPVKKLEKFKALPEAFSTDTKAVLFAPKIPCGKVLISGSTRGKAGSFVLPIM